MAKKHRILWLSVLLAAFLFWGCAAEPPGYFSYREVDFCTELRGELHALPFCAAVTVEKNAQGYRVRVEYLGDPAKGGDGALTGLTVVATLAADGTPYGAATVSCQGLTTDTEGRLLADLLLPISVLLSPTSFATVQKEADGFRLGLEGEGVLTLDETMHPRAYSSPALSFSVQWWERKT